jgi:predicted dehydrogenase
MRSCAGWADGIAYAPTLSDAVRAAEVLDAMVESAASRQWVTV